MATFRTPRPAPPCLCDSVFQKRVTDKAAPLARTLETRRHRVHRDSCLLLNAPDRLATVATFRTPRPAPPCLSVFQIPPWRTNLAGKLFVMRPTLPIRKTSTTRTVRPGHFEFLRNSGKSRFKRYTMYSIRIHSNLSSTTLGSSRPVSLQPNR